jgi:hypothetical protein
MVFVRARASDVATTAIPTFFEAAEIGGELTRYWKDVSKGALDIAIHVAGVGRE